MLRQYRPECLLQLSGPEKFNLYQGTACTSRMACAGVPQ